MRYKGTAIIVLLLLLPFTPGFRARASVAADVPEAVTAPLEKTYGQRTAEARIKKIKSLFDNGMYSVARDEIRNVTETYALSESQRVELASMDIVCNIRLWAVNIDALVAEYTREYRYAAPYMSVMLQYADYYFDKDDFVRAQEIMDGIDSKLLSRKEKERYQFRLAYCQLKNGQTDLAGAAFSSIIRGRHTQYTVPSYYYAGYVAYLNKDFRRAISLLSKVRNDDYFGVHCAYYLLEAHLMLQDYGYVMKNGKAVWEAVDDMMKGKVSRIVSQAYYSMDRTEEAEQWFERYSSNADMTRKDHYFAGILAYSMRSYREAIVSFGKVLEENDSLSQSAAMHIANSFLKVRNKHEAIKYYYKASQMKFDKDIERDSYFNYAKLSFDLKSDIQPFQEYLERWPKSRRSDEIYSYIATSYLASKNYKSAISAMNKIYRLTPEMDVNLQKAAFLRALELFDRGNYHGAEVDFQIALRHTAYNPALGQLTRFWLAETYYRMGRPDEALDLYEYLDNSDDFASFGEYPLMLFGAGYCCFAKADYEGAYDWFQRFVEHGSGDMEYVVEAKSRMADVLFMKREYARAALAYEEVVNIGYQEELSLYAAYQSAVSYGLVPRMDKKIAVLEEILANRMDSPLYSKALYELGRTYVQEGMTGKAERNFQYMLEDVRDSAYVDKVLLELGMLYSNAGDYPKALSYFTRVVEDRPLSKDTENALAAIESIYTVLNQPQEYFDYLDRIGFTDTKTEDEKELMLFNAAEQIFLSGDYVSAERSLREFVELYPDVVKSPAAYFYLGETLAALDKKEEAAEAYAQVMDKGDGSFVELSTLRYAEICYGLGRYGEAASAFEALQDVARLDNNKQAAMTGIMRSYFRDERHNLAIEAAEKVLSAGYGDWLLKMEAQYVVAKSCLALGRRTQALEILKELSETKYTSYGAEATFLLIQDTYDAGEFEEVENLVYAFSQAKTDKIYWLAKSFIVLGDSFAEREEFAQARATFQSILDEYTPESPDDDVLEQVQMRLERLAGYEAEAENDTQENEESDEDSL